MLYNYYTGKMPFAVDNITYIIGSRPKGRTASFENGRKADTIIYVYSGKLEYTFENETVFLQSGDLMFCPVGDKCKCRYTKESKIGVLMFNTVSGKLPAPFSGRFIDSDGTTVEEWEKVSRECKSDPVLYAARIYDMIRIISDKKSVLPKKYSRLSSALRDIEFYYMNSHPVSHYAELCSVSEPTFRRIFTEYTGLSPIEYRNRVRLQNAERMIASGEYSVEEAAQSVGFTNLSFFYRSYKKLFGHKPM